MITRVEDLVKYAGNGKEKPRIVVAAAEDRNAIETVCQGWKQGLIEATLVGAKDKIMEIADDIQADLDPFEVVDRPEQKSCIEESLTLVAQGSGDILMKGHVNTGDLMRKVLEKQYGLRPERVLSHVGVFTAPGEERIMILTDAGINIAPDLTRKRDIILNAVEVARTLGIACPKVAVLAFIEKVPHPSVQSTMDAAMLTEMNRKGDIQGCIVEGPYALDNAVSPESARTKNIRGEVAGCADILVAHDINMGNAIYKSLQIWVKAVIASVVVGSKTLTVAPSRADSKESKLQSIALAILLMREKQKT